MRRMIISYLAGYLVTEGAGAGSLRFPLSVTWQDNYNKDYNHLVNHFSPGVRRCLAGTGWAAARSGGPGTESTGSLVWDTRGMAGSMGTTGLTPRAVSTGAVVASPWWKMGRTWRGSRRCSG